MTASEATKMGAETVLSQYVFGAYMLGAQFSDQEPARGYVDDVVRTAIRDLQENGYEIVLIETGAAKAKIASYSQHTRLDDRLVDGFFCECGVEVVPDCDMSRVSINAAFDAHRTQMAALRLNSVKIVTAVSSTDDALIDLGKAAVCAVLGVRDGYRSTIGQEDEESGITAALKALGDLDRLVVAWLSVDEHRLIAATWMEEA